MVKNASIQRIAILFFLLMSYAGVAIAQQYEGIVREAESELPLEGVRISFVEPAVDTEAVSDASGSYQISLPDGESFVLRFSKSGYKEARLRVDRNTLAYRGSLAPMYLEPDQIAWLSANEDEAFASFIVEDLGEEVSSVGQSPILLTASRDPYTNKAGFQFSPMRFRIRGYDSPYQEQLLNGMQMNNLNNGYSAWSLWNGLNNITINQEAIEGLGVATYGLGSVGGAVNIDTRPSNFGRGGRVTYSLSNRSYNHRTMFTYHTSLMPNGWALSFSGSKRWGKQGYSPGQFYDAYGYYLGIEKHFGSRHAITFIGLGAPTERGVVSAATQEVYDLVGSNHYNPNVGLQDGRWRNARVRNSHEPLFQLQYNYLGDGFKLTSGVGFRFGYNGYSALNWHNAPDPRPDYYRYLPSYYSYMTEQPNSYLEEYYREAWANDPNVRHINWEQLYHINQNNQTDVYSYDGRLLASGKRSEYVVEDRRNDQMQINANTVANITLNSRMKLDVGANYRRNKTKNFNVLKDLLGGDFWYDIDKFSERDFPDDPSKAQLDLNNPDRIVKEGDIYSHNYDSFTEVAELWGSYSYTTRYIDSYAALEGSWTHIYRDGKQRRGLFPENSFGKSEQLHFWDYAIKAGLVGKFANRHFTQFNVAYLTKAPYFNDLFISPRTNNFFIDNPTSEKIFSTDVSYLIRHPFVKGRVTLYYTRFMDGMRKRSFYDDAYRAFSNIVLTNIDRQHMGIELGFEVKLLPSLTATAVFSYGSYTYANNPDYIQTVDNNRELLEKERVYWKGYHVAGTPQSAANLSLTYQTPFYMYLGLDLNYFDRGYIDLNPKLRTDIAREQLAPEYIRQEKFPAQFTMDANVGYSWRIQGSQFLRINLTVTNILNNKGAKSGGYEQSRIRQTRDGKMMRPFDPRYYYMIGTNFFLNVAYLF